MAVAVVFTIALGAYLSFSEIQRVAADTDAGTNIDTTNRHAWSDVSGWWDFHYYHNVVVGTSSLSGYASSSISEISLDCHTSPTGDICSTSNYQVTNPDGGGSLSGCAWNDQVGWISFWCGDGDCDGSGVEDASSTCSNAVYRVTVDANGIFQDYAWNDVEGWISFNCLQDEFNQCGDSDYKVETSWRPGRLTGILESSIFDTGISSGVTLNNIIWQGSQPAGTCVKFQIAASNNSSGPWNFWGPDAACDGSGDAGTYFGNSCPGPNLSIKIASCDRDWIKDKRYLRYKVILESDFQQSVTSRVDDIILNWSR